MTRTITLLLSLLLLVAQTSAQNAIGPDRSETVADPGNFIPAQARLLPTPSQAPEIFGGNCTNADSLSAASNIYSIILTESNPIVADNALNTLVFIHRNNVASFGGHSGQLRYDLSTNGGSSWTSNQGPLNPASINGSNAARYPGVSIYNPPNNTNPNNAYLVYQAPTVNTTWNGVVNGVRRLNGTGNTENYNQPASTNTLIPRATCKGAPGVFWSIDAVFSTQVTGFRVYKGTWNTATSDVVWTTNTTITPPFNLLFDGNPHSSDFNIAFDPSGMNGWICILGHITPGPTAFSFYPIFYHTTDGGVTWSNPEQVDISQFNCISGNIVANNFATTAYDMDLVVDVKGNPHCVVPIANGNSAYALFFTQWHAIMDITLDNGVWNPVLVRNAYRGRGTYGTLPNQVSLDMDCQASRTEDGTKVFFTWCDADSSQPLAVADQSPNLYGRAYDVINREWSNPREFTACSPANGQVLFPRMANTVLGASSNYQLPVVYAKLNASGEPINAADFVFLDSLYFTDSDFLTLQCAASVSIAQTDTIVVCGSTTLDAGPGAQVYRWSTGATTQTIPVTVSGSYSIGINANCCTGADTVYVIVDSLPTAAFGNAVNGLAVNLTDLSSTDVSSWSWDFGDGSTSTLQNPMHTYVLPGTYTVCLTATDACSSDTTCQSVTVTCPPASAAWSSSNIGLTVNFTDMTVGSGISWSWAFGDGTFSSLQNPSHTYAMAGTFTACLAITDSCGSDTLCQLITACPVPMAAFTFAATLGIVAFTDGSSPAPTTWAWDFGDGGTATVQNPQHTYTASGTYTACLTITDACGTDTICQSVNVNVVGLERWEAVQVTTSPNPVSDVLRLQVDGAPAGQMTLRLRNPLGQEIWHTSLRHSGNTLDQMIPTAQLAPGLYFVEVEMAHHRWVGKVLRR